MTIELLKHETESNKLLVLYKTPSLLINGGTDYVSVTMPHCLEFSNEIIGIFGCKYDGIPLLKYQSSFIISKINSEDPMFLHLLIDSMIFSESQVNDILRRAASSSILYEEVLTDVMHNPDMLKEIENEYNKIACNWVTENSDLIKTWTPFRGNSSEEDSVKIGALLPFFKNNNSPLIKAFNKAIESIKSNKELSKYVKYEAQLHEQNCEIEESLKTIINWYSSQDTLAILGPPCNEDLEVVASKYTLTTR